MINKNLILLLVYYTWLLLAADLLKIPIYSAVEIFIQDYLNTTILHVNMGVQTQVYGNKYIYYLQESASFVTKFSRHWCEVSKTQIEDWWQDDIAGMG